MTEAISSWTLPAAVQEEYRTADDAVRDTTLRLGALEADYVSAKNGLLVDLDKKLKARVEVVTKAAKDAGINVDGEKWVLDTKAMVLKKE